MKLLLRLLAGFVLLLLAAGAVFYLHPLWVNDQITRYHLWRAGVRSEYLTVDNHRIHYFEALPPNGSPGTPLILIHGLGARSENWAPMIAPLAAAGFHVYVPDLLGYGRSDKPANVVYSIPYEENVVLNFMHGVHLTHADLDGWSMGGWIAAKIALDHPEMVDRLVLDDSAGITFQPAFDRTAFVPTDPAGLTHLFALLTPRPPQLPGFVVRATLRRIALAGPIIQQSMDTMEAGHDILDARLPGLTQPTLIVWGTRDALIPIAVGETMHRDIPHSVFLRIAGCGHLSPEECPQPVLTGTIHFLKANPPMPPADLTLPGNSPHAVPDPGK